ncbi:MAG: hypothetical protein ACJATT_004188 [Myxococcota bacterium]
MRTLFLLCLLVGCPTADTADIQDTEDTGPVPLPDCPDYEQVTSVNVVGSVLSEASGLVLGSNDVLWSHNDSGDTPRLIALDVTGEALGVVRITNVDARDWEDIARMNHPELGSTLVIADLGDNDRRRDDTALVLLAEPAAPGSGRSLSVTAQSIGITYSDGPQNVEAITIDPLDQTLLVITKSDAGSTLYTAAPGWWDVTALTLEPVGTLLFGTPPLDGSTAATGADTFADGRAIVIRTYSGAWYFRRPAGPLLGAFDTEPCEIPGTTEQGEAIAVVGDAYLTLPEGVNPALVRYEIE